MNVRRLAHLRQRLRAALTHDNPRILLVRGKVRAGAVLQTPSAVSLSGLRATASTALGVRYDVNGGICEPDTSVRSWDKGNAAESDEYAWDVANGQGTYEVCEQ